MSRGLSVVYGVVGVALAATLVWGSWAMWAANEDKLDARCDAAGGRRVDIGVGEKLCFTEDWRWVKI